MKNSENNVPDPIDRLPDALREMIEAETQREAVRAVAGYDLDEHGRYTEGWLVLTDDCFAELHRRNGEWATAWKPISALSSATIVEGVGVGILRLLKDGAIAGEYRFSRRHAKDVARLQRRLEKIITGDEGEEPPPEAKGAGDKKIRCEKCDRVIPPWSEVCPACLSRRKVLSRLLDFVGPYKLRAAGGITLALLATGAHLVRPFLTRPMLDRGLGTAPGVEANYSLLLMYILLMAGLTVFGAVAEAVRGRLMATLGARMARDIRDRTYRHLHNLSLSFFSRRPTGSLVTRVTSDSDRIWDFVAFTLVELTIAILTVIGVGVALFVLNWKLALIVLTPIPLMFAITILFHRKLHTGFHRIFHRWSQMTAVAADALPGVRVIKAFSQEKREVDRFGRRNLAVYEGETDMIRFFTLFRPLMQFCSQIGTLLVWIVGGYWVVRGWMTAGTLVAYIGYMWMFYGPIQMIAHMDRMFNRAATSVQRIFEILDTEPAIFSGASATRACGLRGDIELQKVSFSYDGVRKVLNDIDLKIEAGEMVGLAGPSGGGKTTMVNLICRFYDVLEGRILIDGMDVRDYDVESVRREIGVVLQEPFLFHGTVAGNIAYGKPDATLREIIDAARAANAHEFIVRFPDGYDTVVGERGHTLSGGERQRISIARAILNNPRILILDEATSSVDTETEKLIQEALERLIAKRTTIAIAHRLSTLQKASRLIILDKGRIVEEGSHEELLAREDGLYAKLTRMQTELQAQVAIKG